MIVFGTTFQSNNIKYIKCSCTHLVSHAGAMFLTVLFLAWTFYVRAFHCLPYPPHGFKEAKNSRWQD